MEPSAGPPDRITPVSEARSAAFTVIVERSGGIAGLLRRWTAEIPDDGGAASRAAHRIAGLAPGPPPPENGRSNEAPHEPDPGKNPATSGLQSSGADLQVRRGRGAARDAFQWSVSCGAGSLRCDEAERRQDPEVDELIRAVTSAEVGPPDAS